MREVGSERLHALDAARGFALLLGIVFHATVSFLPAPPGVPLWVVMDNHRSVTLSVVFYVVHMFRMTMFFLVAGFFARMSFHKKGPRGFARDRLKRIGIPLVVGWPILFAAIAGVSIIPATAELLRRRQGRAASSGTESSGEGDNAPRLAASA